jgi:hypothetical protein
MKKQGSDTGVEEKKQQEQKREKAKKERNLELKFSLTAVVCM